MLSPFGSGDSRATWRRLLNVSGPGDPVSGDAAIPTLREWAQINSFLGFIHAACVFSLGIPAVAGPQQKLVYNLLFSNQACRPGSHVDKVLLYVTVTRVVHHSAAIATQRGIDPVHPDRARTDGDPNRWGWRRPSWG